MPPFLLKKSSLFTFFLDKKSNKKIKANPIAPLDLPGQRTISRVTDYKPARPRYFLLSANSRCL
jgi:hypothetical protein